MIGEIVPVLGVLVGLVVPLACFFWAYHEDKGKREAVVEIAKHPDDPAKIEELLTIFDERKSAPIDYRRGGVITLFVGVGIYLFGQASLGAFFAGIGLLVGAIGVGVMIAGYFYPNTSEELTSAVEEFEKK
jgi:hypothetical protein